jgi:hypothetical protein
VDDPGPRQFGEARVEVQRSTVEPYDRSKADPEEAITESIERPGGGTRPRVAKGAPPSGCPSSAPDPLASSWPHPMRFKPSACPRSKRASSRSLARVPPL